jgi:hypothetical protein
MKIDHPHWLQSQTDALRRGASEHMLADALAATAELCGRPLSAAAVGMLVNDLRLFDEAQILGALARCRMELRGPLQASEIIARIEDGRPSAEEAWAMLPRSEQASVVWTEEMAQAWGVAQPLLNAGDRMARTAFEDAYAKAVLVARIEQRPVRWTPSLGSDAGGRERALREAVDKRRLTAAHAEQLLPDADATAGGKDIVAQLRLKSVR